MLNILPKKIAINKECYIIIQEQLLPGESWGNLEMNIFSSMMKHNVTRSHHLQALIRKKRVAIIQDVAHKLISSKDNTVQVLVLSFLKYVI